MGQLTFAPYDLARMAKPRRSSGQPVDDDLGRQLRCIADLAVAFGLWAPKAEASEGTDQTPLPAPARRSLYESDELDLILAATRRMRGESRRMVVAQLEHAQGMGHLRLVTTAPEPAALDHLHRTFPNFEPATTTLQRQLALCRLAPDRALELQPLLLAGSPGIGKTAYAQAVARALGSKFERIDIASLSAGFSLAGLDASYDSSKPGLVWNAINDTCLSPTLLLDELDKPPKGGSAILGCLYTLLERHTAKQFTDAALNLKVDASHICWMATCNDTDDIEPALLSRFEVLEISMPKLADMPDIVSSVQKELMAEVAWSGYFNHDLDGDVMNGLCQLTPREIRRVLKQAYARAASAGRNRLQFSDLPIQYRSKRHAIGFTH